MAVNALATRSDQVVSDAKQDEDGYVGCGDAFVFDTLGTRSLKLPIFTGVMPS